MFLDKNTQILLEKKLRQYFEYKNDISDYRKGIIYSTAKYYGGVGDKYHHSDSTAKKGMALAEPPADIRYKQAWVEIIEELIEKYKGTKIGQFLQLRYFDEEGMYYIQKKLQRDRLTCFLYRTQILTSLYILALKHCVPLKEEED